MRDPAPTPQGTRTGTVEGGYQLCARCGGVLVDGDNAVAVPRSPSWLVYTHAHRCRRNAVRGWQAVLRAEGVRDSANVPTPRPASESCHPVSEHLGSARPCVCLLDNKHVKAELSLVTYWPSDERPAKPGDIGEVLENRLRRDLADGWRRRGAVAPESQDESECAPSFVRWAPNISRNWVEDNFVAAIDGSGFRWLDWWVRHMWKIRARSYATARALAGSEESGRPLFIFWTPPLRTRRPPPKRDSIPPKTQRQLAVEGRLQEAAEKQLAARKPRAKLLPASHKDRPDLYICIKPGDSRNGPVMLFNPIFLALLRTRPALLRLNLALLGTLLAPPDRLKEPLRAA